jgi:hypothetical protein
MLKIVISAFMLPLLLLFGSRDENSPNASSAANTSSSRPDQSGTLQKMIVASGSATMELDLDSINPESFRDSTTGRLETAPSPKLSELHFAVAPNSFFPILVFNNMLRGPKPGSMGLVPQNNVVLPPALAASLNRLAIEKIGSSASFDMSVRDAMSGFVFFNIQGNRYDYDASSQSFGIHGGRLLISKEFATALGRRADAGLVVGKISVRTTMQPIEITQLVNGKPNSMVLPPLSQRAGPGAPTLVHGPDIIVGDLPDMLQVGNAGSQVGLGVATTSCNNGDQPVNFLALPNTDHPFFPQNFYRMSGGTDNTARFEKIGQAWIKHTFGADEGDDCNLGCNTNNCTQFSQLCPGCSDPYLADENGWYDLLGSRAWVNPFTGAMPSTAADHSGHVHDGVSHRVRVNIDDLNTTLNTGATYFAEAAYLDPLEYTWCQAHPGQCNMYNNASYRQFSVTGITDFTFSPVGQTQRMQPAIMAWTGATINQVQPDPGNDGISFVGYKVTSPAPGVYHYEYAVYNYNLDRSIQSFSVPLGAGANLSNIGFHAPPQEPGWANDGTFNNQGYSSTPWAVTQASDSITWNSETFAQNQNANAIRFGTLYNFRFDADQPPQGANATVGFFKTGSPMTVGIQAPGGGGTPTPTPSPSASPTATATSTPTATATATPTSTPTSTPRPSPTPRILPTPRIRPTTPPRP